MVYREAVVVLEALAAVVVDVVVALAAVAVLEALAAVVVVDLIILVKETYVEIPGHDFHFPIHKAQHSQ